MGTRSFQGGVEMTTPSLVGDGVVMSECVLTFASRVEGIEFRSIDCPSDHPSITKVEVSSGNGGDVTFKISLTDVSDPGEARAIARRAAARAADALSFNLGRAVTEPRLVEEAATEVIVDVSGKRDVHAKVGTVISTVTQASCVSLLGEAGLGELETALSRVNPPGEPNYVLFRSALGATGPASKFLALYQILDLLINQDKIEANQDKIDQFIREQDPSVPVTKTKPRKNGSFKDETLYTRLRNEYMHNRSDVTLAATRAGMEANLAGLVSLVQTAIKRTPGGVIDE
jgi:hypothetical protein